MHSELSGKQILCVFNKSKIFLFNIMIVLYSTLHIMGYTLTGTYTYQALFQECSHVYVTPYYLQTPLDEYCIIEWLYNKHHSMNHSVLYAVYLQLLQFD